MVDRVLGNFHAELSLSSRELLTAMAATGMISPSTLFARKASIVRDAIGDLRTHLLQVPVEMSADQASDVIVSHLLAIAEQHGRLSADAR